MREVLLARFASLRVSCMLVPSYHTLSQIYHLLCLCHSFFFDVLFFLSFFRKTKICSFVLPDTVEQGQPCDLQNPSHEVNQKSSTNLHHLGIVLHHSNGFLSGVPWRLSALGVHKLDCLPNGEPLTTPATGVGCGLVILWYSWTQQKLSYVGIKARNES